MEKDDLMAFIQKKSQEILLRVDEPQQIEAYFFWQLMELFCSCDRVSVVDGYLNVEAKFSVRE